MRTAASFSPDNIAGGLFWRERKRRGNHSVAGRRPRWLQALRSLLATLESQLDAARKAQACAVAAELSGLKQRTRLALARVKASLAEP